MKAGLRYTAVLVYRVAMIGFLVPVGLRPAEHRLGRSYECGLCHVLGAEYGQPYRLLAGPDLVFFNVLAEAEAPGPVVSRGCPLTLGIGRVAAREATRGARVAAAVGVYMAVEKLRDDWADEGGLHRWVAWRALRPGWRKARAALVEAGVAVEEIEALLADQARVERTPALSLSDAAVPSERIGRAVFAAAAPRPDVAGIYAEIGARVARWVFLADALLDLPEDRAKGRYNPLLRAGDPDAARTDALAVAWEQAAALERLLDALPHGEHRAYLHGVVATGFRDRLRRIRALDPAKPARLTDVLPKRRFSLSLAMARVRAVVSLALYALSPRSAWVARRAAAAMALLAPLLLTRARADSGDTATSIDTSAPADTGVSPDTGTSTDSGTLTETGFDPGTLLDTGTAGDTAGADTGVSPVGDTSAADTSAADTSAADTSAADTSAADTSVADTSTTDTSADTSASDTSGAVDTGLDTSADTSVGGSDSGIDTSLDTSAGGTDTSTDTSSDTSADTSRDTATDTSGDTSVDTGVDTGPDTGPDTGIDTGPDTGVDTGPDTGIDTGPDSGHTGRDTGDTPWDSGDGPDSVPTVDTGGGGGDSCGSSDDTTSSSGSAECCDCPSSDSCCCCFT